MSTKLTLLLHNDSIQILHPEPPSPHLPCTFLLLILAASFLIDSLILLSILSSPLRSSLYNLLLAAICGVGVFEALFNIASSVLIRASWQEMYESYGRWFLEALSRCNATTMQITPSLQAYILCVLSLDRAILLGAATKAPGSRPASHGILTRLWPLTCVVVLVLTLPLASGFIPARVFEKRYSCSPVHASQDLPHKAVAILNILLSFVVPWLLSLYAWLLVARRVMLEQRRLQHLEMVARQRAAERRSPVRSLGGSSLGFSNVAPGSQIWGPENNTTGEGFRFYLLAVSLLVLYAVLVVPHAVLVQVTQFHSRYDVVVEEPFFFNTTMPVDLLPLETHVLDAVCLWGRYIFVLISPILMLLLHTELRGQLARIVCCCFSRNQIQARSVSAYIQEQDTKKKHEHKRRQISDKYKRVADFKTPVLFATSEGLHLRTFEGDNFDLNLLNGPNLSSSSRDQKTVMWTSEPGFVCEFCDLASTVPAESLRNRKTIPKLSQTPPLTRSILEPDVRIEESEHHKAKTGKSVRFSQNVNEIALTESGIYSDDQSENVMQVKPRSPLPLLNRVSMSRLQEKRNSDTFIKFPAAAEVNRNMLRDRTRSLELDLVQNGNLNASSASLLLSLSQRMRNRNS